MQTVQITEMTDRFHAACADDQDEALYVAAAGLIARIEDLPTTADTLALKARAALWCIGDDLESELCAATADRRLQAQLVEFLSGQ
jgi:hypothetical protein